jgi:hypothetical protein
MALTNPYCQVADVRSQLADATTKLDTALIEKAVSAASRAIDRYCGRRFWQDPAPVPRLYMAPDPCLVDVDDISTTTGLSVKVDTGADGTYATTWAASDYQLRPLNASADGGAYSWRQIAAMGGKSFPCRRYGGYPALQVTAQWGWSAIPDDVVEAAVLKSVSLFSRKDAPFGVAGFGEFGPVRITKRDPDVVDLLSPFQLAVVA